MKTRWNAMMGCVLGGLMTLAPATAGADTVSTPLDADILNDGVMFDVSVLGGPVTLQSLGVHADFGTFDYAVFLRAGGIGNAVNDPSGWTRIGSFAAVTTAGFGALTALDFDDVLLAAGATYGLYVTDTQGAFSVGYSTSARSVGDVLASDSRLAIRTGYGLAYPFGDAASPRDFNGAVTFVAVPEPATWLLMVAGVGAMGGAMRRRSRVRVAYA